MSGTCPPDCAHCAATACRTCESAGITLTGPCMLHVLSARHVASPADVARLKVRLRAGTDARPVPAPGQRTPKCPGCGVPLTWDGWSRVYTCESGRHPDEGKGVRSYRLGKRGKLRAASAEANPRSPKWRPTPGQDGAR